jgi:hypothetical protein
LGFWGVILGVFIMGTRKPVFWGVQNFGGVKKGSFFGSVLTPPKKCHFWSIFDDFLSFFRFFMFFQKIVFFVVFLIFMKNMIFDDFIKKTDFYDFYDFYDFW